MTFIIYRFHHLDTITDTLVHVGANSDGILDQSSCSSSECLWKSVQTWCLGKESLFFINVFVDHIVAQLGLDCICLLTTCVSYKDNSISSWLRSKPWTGTFPVQVGPDMLPYPSLCYFLGFVCAESKCCVGFLPHTSRHKKSNRPTWCTTPFGWFNLLQETSIQKTFEWFAHIYLSLVKI